MTRLVMEATGDYWRAPFHLLEGRVETWLVNAAVGRLATIRLPR